MVNSYELFQESVIGSLHSSLILSICDVRVKMQTVNTENRRDHDLGPKV